MIIPPNMEHQKLTLRGCLGLIVFTLSLLLGFWLVVKFDMCPYMEKGAKIGLENRPTILISEWSPKSDLASLSAYPPASKIAHLSRL